MVQSSGPSYDTGAITIASVLAGAAEAHIAYISDLFMFCRSVTAHIVASDRAWSLLDYMAFLPEPPSEEDEKIIASDGSLS